MGRKEITTKEDLMKVIELFENTGITYWLDGGWGVDILAGKQTRMLLASKGRRIIGWKKKLVLSSQYLFPIINLLSKGMAMK